MSKIFLENGKNFCEKCKPKIEEQIQKKKERKTAKVKGVMIHENYYQKSHEPARGVGVV